MAHGDYDCCARCDSKMAYSSFADTKEQVCSDCALDLMELTGERIVTGEQLAAWVLNASAGQLEAVGIKTCFYPNPVDESLVARREELARLDTEGGT